MHPRPPAAKHARVSFDPDLAVATDTLITKGDPATEHPSGGWGGHWPIRTEMPQQTAGNGKEAMEPPVNTTFLRDVQPPALKRHAGPRHADSSHQNPGGGSGSANRTQVTGSLSRGRDPMAPNLNVPTDTGRISTTPWPVTQMDAMNIDTFDSSMPSTCAPQMLPTEASAIRRRGPKTRRSGDHRHSAKNNGARPPSPDCQYREPPPTLTFSLLLPPIPNIHAGILIKNGWWI